MIGNLVPIWQIENWMKSHGAPVGEASTDSTVILITEGHKVPRNVLHPEAAYRGLDLKRMSSSPWSPYVDLLSWCKEASFLDANSRLSISTLADAIEGASLGP